MTDGPFPDGPFIEVVPGMQVANAATEDAMYVVFGDTEYNPRRVELLDRMKALKASIALAAAVTGRPVFGRNLVANVLLGASTAVPPSRVKVLVTDGDDVRDAYVYGVTETAVTILVGEGEDGRDVTKDVQPSQILRMKVVR